MGLTNYGESIVFDDDWFGDASPANPLHVIEKGRWAYLPVMEVSPGAGHMSTEQSKSTFLCTTIRRGFKPKCLRVAEGAPLGKADVVFREKERR